MAQVPRTYHEANDRPGDEERSRMQLIERVHDHVTSWYLDRIGVKQGWRCLEIGAGAGSVARELAGRVGTGGEVVAADIVTRFLGAVPANVTVLTANLVTDDLDLTGGGFDLIHGRAVLVHIPERDQIVGRLAECLKPGGVLFLEEPIFGKGDADRAALDHDRFAAWSAYLAALKDVVRATGSEIESFGVRLASLVGHVGLTVEIAERHSTLLGDGSAMRDLWAMTTGGAGKRFVEAGLVSAEVVAGGDAVWNDPTFFGELFGFQEIVARRPNAD